MSILWLDGFDDLTGSGGDFTSSGYLNGGQETKVSGYTPTGIGQSLAIDSESGSGNFTLNKAIGPCSDLIMGFHYLLSSENPNYITSIYNGDAFGNYRQIGFLISNEQAGLTFVNSANGAAVGISTPNIVYAGVWYYIELRINFADGTLVVRVDETEVINETGLAYNFQLCNIVTWGGRLGYLYETKQWDNLYILDGSVGDAPFNDFLGECIVYTGRPVADVGPNQWTPTGVGLLGHYDALNDVTHNDADYLSIDSSGKEELFDMDDMPITTLEVLAVAIAPRIMKAAGAPGQYQVIAKIGAAQSNLPTRGATASMSTKLEILETKPGGGSWTLADANALQVGLVTV